MFQDLKMMNTNISRESQNNELHISNFDVFSQIIASIGRNFLRLRLRRSRYMNLCIGFGYRKNKTVCERVRFARYLATQASADDPDLATSIMFKRRQYDLKKETRSRYHTRVHTTYSPSDGTQNYASHSRSNTTSLSKSAPEKRRCPESLAQQ